MRVSLRACVFRMEFQSVLQLAVRGSALHGETETERRSRLRGPMWWQDVGI